MFHLCVFVQRTSFFFEHCDIYQLYSNIENVSESHGRKHMHKMSIYFFFFFFEIQFSFP